MDAVNLCETCKHWGGPGQVTRYNLTGHDKCNNDKLEDVIADHPDGACDDEAWGGIVTGPKFGCIHHEKKSG